MQERFEPVGTTLMILSLVSANLMMAYLWSPESSFIYSWKRLAGGFLLIWLTFFHMRLFDEIKDYDVDCEVNKERPLPRGLISLSEIGFLTFLCFVIEITLAWNLRFAVFTTYLAVAGFTLLMRMEFFLSSWLGPKMELYAITHTFSASLMGVLTFSVLTNLPMNELPLPYIYIALSNWFVFNVFEFGRKTFSIEEERDAVESYSNRLTPFGAVILLAVNLIIAWILLYMSLVEISILRFNGEFIPLLKTLLIYSSIPCAIVLLSGIIYSFSPLKKMAKLYRGSVSLYLLAYHAIIGIYGYMYFINYGGK